MCETAALIRKRRKSAHTPIIFITGYADELHKAQGYSLGAVDYILSPVNPDILRTKVRVFIELFQMMQQATPHADERVARIQAEAAREMAEAAHRRSSFLAESSATLAGSLEHITTSRALARLSVPTLAAAEAFGKIKKEVGYVPLVADIHFNYKCGLAAAEAGADCLRINPGNIGSDKKVSEVVACAKHHGIDDPPVVTIGA